ncbi:hypothetical protein LJC14_02240 [Treponema sp. OttesenSCG-928-L16]|nr:hypothetical protein [Treponema sp. OttesenSCG-928-L16]
MGIGQESMLERIERIGGSVGFSSSKYGYTVSISIPYSQDFNRNITLIERAGEVHEKN